MPNIPYAGATGQSITDLAGVQPNVGQWGPPVGDGIADDTAAIQAAVAALVARGGGTLLFPPQCMCRVTETITDGGVSILFCGSGAGSGLAGNGITILHLTQHGSQCVDMEIRASGTSADTVGLYLSGVEAGRLIGNLAVQNVKLVGDAAHGVGIKCLAVIESKLYGIDIQQWATGIEILNDGPYAPPATFGQCSALEIAGGVIAFNSNGVVIDNDDAILSIHSIAIRKHSANGIWVKSTSSALTLNVSGCQLEQVDGAGTANIRMDAGWLLSRGNGYYGPNDGDIVIGSANGNSHSSYQDLLNNGITHSGSGVVTIKDHQLDTAPTITGGGIVVISRNATTTINTTALPAAHLRAPSRAYTNEYGHLCMSDSADATKRLYMGVDSSAGTAGMAHIQALRSGVGALPLRLQPYGGKVLVKKLTDGGLALVEIDGSVYLADYIALGNAGSSAITVKPSALLNPTSNALVVQASSGATMALLTDAGAFTIGGKLKVSSTAAFDGADIGAVVGAPSDAPNDGSVRMSNNGNLYIYTASAGWVALVKAVGEMLSLVLKGSNPYLQIEKVGVLKFEINSEGVITVLPHVAGPILSKAANAALEVQDAAGTTKFKVNSSGQLQEEIVALDGIIDATLSTSSPVVTGAGQRLISAKINLASTSHVDGTLPIANGGTGATTAGGALTALGAAASGHDHAGVYASKNVSTGVTITLAKLTPGGTNGSITFNDDGQRVSSVDPT